MKKIWLIGLCLLLLSCSDEQSQIEMTRLETAEIELKLQIDQLNYEKRELFEQLDDCAIEKSELMIRIETINENLEKYKSEVTELKDAIQSAPMRIQSDYDISVVHGDADRIAIELIVSQDDNSQKYHVIGDSSYQEVSEVLELGEGSEVVRLIVEGALYNLKWMSIEWNEAYTDYDTLEIHHEQDLLANTQVNIHTMLPEGLPFELMQWENSEGEVKRLMLSYDGYGLESTIIMSE